MPVPDGLVPLVAPERPAFSLTLDPSLASLRLLVVVGPGVVRAGALDGLRTPWRVPCCSGVGHLGVIGVGNGGQPVPCRAWGPAGRHERTSR